MKPLYRMIGSGLLALSLAGAGGIALAGDGQHSGKRMYGPGSGMMMAPLMHPGLLGKLGDELELTTEQRDSIRSAFETQRPAMQSLRERFRTSMQKLEAVEPDAPDYATTVQAVSQEMGALAAEMVTLQADLRAQVHALLTEAQRAELKELQAKRRDAFRQRREQRRQEAQKPAT